MHFNLCMQTLCWVYVSTSLFLFKDFTTRWTSCLPLRVFPACVRRCRGILRRRPTAWSGPGWAGSGSTDPATGTHTVSRADITMNKLQAKAGGQKKAIYQYQRERLRLCLLWYLFNFKGNSFNYTYKAVHYNLKINFWMFLSQDSIFRNPLFWQIQITTLI